MFAPELEQGRCPRQPPAACAVVGKRALNRRSRKGRSRCRGSRAGCPVSRSEVPFSVKWRSDRQCGLLFELLGESGSVEEALPVLSTLSRPHGEWALAVLASLGCVFGVGPQALSSHSGMGSPSASKRELY